MRLRMALTVLFILILIIIVGIWIFYISFNQSNQDDNTSNSIDDNNNISVSNYNLKKDCVNATIKAIELEILKNQKWLEIPDEEKTNGSKTREEIENRLEYLNRELMNYSNINLEDYEIPLNVTLTGWVNTIIENGTLLYFENRSMNDIEKEFYEIMNGSHFNGNRTRSGPFYHIVSIKGNNFNAIIPGIKYDMNIYLAYPREYPFPSWYVHIEDFSMI